DAIDIDVTEETAARRLVEAAFKREYGPSQYEVFEQLDKRRRTLIVDNWHRTPLNQEGRELFLKCADHLFGRILLFADDLYQTQELVSKAVKELLKFDHAVIQEFNHTLRGELIDRWLTMGREHRIDDVELAREIESKENVILTVIGANTLPSSPFIVLCLLQA